jgi:hypothetical protein
MCHSQKQKYKNLRTNQICKTFSGERKCKSSFFADIKLPEVRKSFCGHQIARVKKFDSN